MNVVGLGGELGFWVWGLGFGLKGSGLSLSLVTSPCVVLPFDFGVHFDWISRFGV
jgi:hypothetical protein